MARLGKHTKAGKLMDKRGRGDQVQRDGDDGSAEIDTRCHLELVERIEKVM